MKKRFHQIQFDQERFKNELLAFDALLKSTEALSEKNDLLPFFRQSPNLLLMFANCLHPAIRQADCFAWEYDIFGDFACDFVVGDSKRSAFVFIELEDAKSNSIFVTSGRATSEWGRRFERGFSQIVDWSCKLDDQEKSDAFADNFGVRVINPKYVLMIGRSADLSPSERRRLKWREQHVLVRSQQIRCLTYDEFLEDLELAMVYPQL